jgi:DNA-binding winged helix-turn-helix (wHTH) protein/Flp pilus assembly protein TadD
MRQRVRSPSADDIEAPSIYAFAGFTLDVVQGRLERAGQAIHLRPKSFLVLQYLLEHPHRLISKEDLLAAVWPSAVVTDGALTQVLIDLRRALGDDAHTLIKTVPRRGYLFEADVTVENSRSDYHHAHGPRWSGRHAAVCAVVVGLLLIGATWWAIRPVPDARAAARVLPVPLSGHPGDVQKTVSSTRPYEHYLQATYFHNRRAPGDIERARHHYESALAFDPDYAPAWAGLAGVYVLQLASGQHDVLPAFREAANHAVRLDPDLPEGRIRLAQYFAWSEDPAAADEQLMLARSLSPENPLVLAAIASRTFWRGDFDAGIELQRRTASLDPVSVPIRNNLAFKLYIAGRLQEAETEARIAQALDPSRVSRDALLAKILLLDGRIEEAHLEFDALSADHAARDFGLAITLRALGHPDESLEAFERLKAHRGTRDAVRVAEAYAYFDELEPAFEWLSVATERFGTEVDASVERQNMQDALATPLLQPLHNDPRWSHWSRDLRQKLGMAP